MPAFHPCIASTALTLTLCACCVLHSFGIPLIRQFACAEQAWTGSTPQTNAAVTTLVFGRNKQHNHNAYVRSDSKIPEKRAVSWLSFVAVVSCFPPKVYKMFFFKAFKNTVHTFPSWSCFGFRAFFSECRSAALVCGYTFWTKNDNFQRLFFNL